MKPKSLIRLQPPDKSKLEEARKLRYHMHSVVKAVYYKLALFTYPI